MTSSDWISFWDSQHSIYVNERHAKAHSERIAKDFLPFAPQNGVMLDYGCGEALFADRVAEPTRQLILCEPASNVRAGLAARFAANRKIFARKPEDIAVMAPRSIDTIIMHSVAQYLSAQEFDSLIRLFHRLLRPGGLFVLGDVVPRKVSALDDASALLGFASEHGFYGAAVAGLFRTYFSNYWQLRKSLGLARYSEDEIMAKLDAGGFSAQRARTNIGHNNKRMTFLAHVR